MFLFFYIVGFWFEKEMGFGNIKWKLFESRYWNIKMEGNLFINLFFLLRKKKFIDEDVMCGILNCY